MSEIYPQHDVSTYGHSKGSRTHHKEDVEACLRRLTLENISEMTPTKWFGEGRMYAVSQTVAAPKPVVGGRVCCLLWYADEDRV